ncbi:MAG: Penicillin-binding protein, partial [Bacteroidota bacterium]
SYKYHKLNAYQYLKFSYIMLQLQSGKYYGTISAIWKWFTRLFLVFLFYIFIVNYNFLWLCGGMPSLQEIENPKSQLSSSLISEDGVEIGKYFLENRSPVEFEQLSPNLVNALLATEDARFTKHSGIDLRSIFRVITHFGSAGGGSTLSQQLAKNLFNTRSSENPDGDETQYRGLLMKVKGLRTIIAKTKEWILAIRLESRYTKQEILKMYLNVVSYGNNAYGIQVACKTYFGKNANEVTIKEAATLIGLLQNPSLFNPKLHPERTIARRNVVLSQMLHYQYIDNETKEKLANTGLSLKYKVENQNTGAAPYFRESIKKQLIAIIKELNESRSDEEKLSLYTSGLKIHTTIDSRMQKYAEQSLNNHMKSIQAKFYEHWKGRNPWVDENGKEIKGFLKDAIKRSARFKALAEELESESKAWEVFKKPVPMSVFSWNGEIDTLMSPIDSVKYYKKILNCGFVSMDPNNGHIKAWVGGINFKHFKYDHVRQSKRQPGSTFKPYVYAAAIENAMVGPCDPITDEPVTFGTNDGVLRPWTPQNSTGRYSYRSMTLRHAMAQSINSVAAKLMKRLGPEKVAEFARRVGVDSKLNATPALCLGASEISVFDQVTGYSTFINEGYRIDPIMITKITDKNGVVLKQFHAPSKQVISPQTAFQMVYMLQGAVQESGGTAEGLKKYSCAKDNEIGAKTGTTSNYSDGWFMGVTQKLVTGVWVGGDDRSIHFRTLALGQGAKMAMPAFANYMDKIYDDNSLKNIGYGKMPFKKPESSLHLTNCGHEKSPNDTIQVMPKTATKAESDGMLE